jgi:hypothetical protein
LDQRVLALARPSGTSIITDLSSRQRELPILKNPQMSQDNVLRKEREFGRGSQMVACYQDRLAG